MSTSTFNRAHSGFGKDLHGFVAMAIKRGTLVAALIFGALIATGYATPVVTNASGANAAAIQGAVDQFRANLGQLNPNNGQNFANGRREVNWDGVPDALSAPNSFPGNFFNLNSPRGAVFSTPGSDLQVSSNTASGVPVRFGNLDPSYTNIFQVFSPQRLFTAIGSNVVEVSFFIPGTGIPATVTSFGSVFADVDNDTATYMQFYAVDGHLLGTFNVQPSNNGLSFLGVTFNAGERAARVVIVNGNKVASNGNVDGGATQDVVVMDDFIYSEPIIQDNRPVDFDGDGRTDIAVFRPSSGTWFILNSATSSFRAQQFGLQGDVPVEGDYDGDGRTDLAVFRPSAGTWFILHSSNNAFISQSFGLYGDIPVPGDYDRDGKTDVAVWRPSEGTFFILRSSNGSVQTQTFGLSTDIPIASSLVP